MLIFQYIVVALMIVTAIGWLVKTYIMPVSKKNSNCGDKDCGCN